MKSAKNVIKQTIASLERKEIEATPHEYEREFLEISKKINFETHDSLVFENFVKELSPEEQAVVKEQNIFTFLKLSELLLKRSNKESIEKLKLLILDSLQPSIAISKPEDLNDFSNKLNGTSEFFCKDDIQMEIKKLTENRILTDKEVFESNTKQMSTLSNMIDSQLGDAISVNTKGSSDIGKISQAITMIEKPNLENINLVHSQLQTTADAIKTNMNKTNSKLHKSKDEVSNLKNKIEALEKELLTTKRENDIDHLTSLYTRKAYDKYAIKTEEKFKRTGLNYAIIFFDIDHFKKVNDVYGHEGGDVILSTFARILLKGTRESDVVGRYGGEEFVGLLSFTDKKEIENYIIRIKNIITGNQFIYKDHKISITFSAGVTFRSYNKTYENALNLADELLYKAKNSGRNKIVFQNGTVL